MLKFVGSLNKMGKNFRILLNCNYFKYRQQKGAQYFPLKQKAPLASSVILYCVRSARIARVGMVAQRRGQREIARDVQLPLADKLHIARSPALLRIRRPSRLHRL